MNLGVDPATAAAVAAWLTLGGGVITLAVKFRWVFRADARADRQAEAVADGAAKIVVSLEREIDRLRLVVDDLEKRLRAEAAERFAAEAHLLESRRLLALTERERDTAVGKMEVAYRHSAAAENVAERFKAERDALELQLERAQRTDRTETPGTGLT